MSITKRGSVVLEIVLFMVLVVVTSAVILLLVHFGVISVKAENEQVSVLNTQFLPYAREGNLVISNIEFCENIDESFHCVPKDKFFLGEPVYVLTTVESSTSNSEIMLLENYRLRNPTGDIVLDAEEKNNFHYQLQSSKSKEQVMLKDKFVVHSGASKGEYTFEVIVENLLLQQKVTAIKKVEIENG